MTDPPLVPEPSAETDGDLVEYVIVAVPETAALRGVALALAEMVASGVVRVLDLVVMVRNAGDRTASVLEIEAVDSLTPLHGVEGEVGGFFSEHDIELAALTLEPERAAIMLLLEDRWAEPLANAARRVGGRLVSGERIPRGRVAPALGQALEGL